MTTALRDDLPVRHGVPLAGETTLRVGGPARDLVEVTSTPELVEVVRRLEAGGATLEESLALWERGEALAAICQSWLDGARERLDAVLAERALPDGAGQQA